MSPNEAEHHRLTVGFLSPQSPLRHDVESMALSVPLSNLSSSFIARVLELKWVPVVERIVEGKHSLISRALGGRKQRRSGVIVSLASGRMQ